MQASAAPVDSSDRTPPPASPPAPPPASSPLPSAEPVLPYQPQNGYIPQPPFPNHPANPFYYAPASPAPQYYPTMQTEPSPGQFVSPGTAVVCILVIAGIYWAFKMGDTAGGMPALAAMLGGGGAAPTKADAGADSKDSKSSSSSSKDKEKDKEGGASLPSIPPISPYAFISLFCFALLAAVLIQGPLGLGDAFAGRHPLVLGGDRSAQGYAAPASTVNGMTSLVGLLPKIFAPGLQPLGGIDLLGLGKIQPQTASVPQMGGHGQTGPGGISSWDWFVNSPHSSGQHSQGNPGPPPAGIPGLQNIASTVGGQGVPAGMTQADAFAYLSLPPLLQAVPFCKASPDICTTLMANVDLHTLSQMLRPFVGPDVDVNSLMTLLGQQATAQPAPIPLIPQKGFLGSVQGVQSVENAFYPLLIGAIGLVILFDYGT